MKNIFSAKSLYLTTLSVATAGAIATTACSTADTPAGELLDIATKTLGEAGMKPEKGLNYERVCYAPNPQRIGDVIAGSGGCTANFSGVAVKNALRYDVEVYCLRDATQPKDCAVTKMTVL